MSNDFILLSKQKKLNKAKLKQSLRTVPINMIPTGAIPLNGGVVDIDQVNILKDLPIHDLCEPHYFATVDHTLDVFIGSYNGFIELDTPNNFVAGMDQCAITPFAKNNSYRPSLSHLIGGIGALHYGAGFPNKAIISANAAYKNGSVFTSSIYSFPLTNGIFPTLQLGAAIPFTNIDMSAKFAADVNPAITADGLEHIIAYNPALKIAYLFFAFSFNGEKLVYQMRENDATFTKITTPTPLNNNISRPVRLSRQSSPGQSFINIFDLETGGFRIPTNKELIFKGVAYPIYNPTTKQTFIFAQDSKIGTIIYELVDNVNGVDIINPVVYSNPTLRQRRIINQKTVDPLCVDSVSNIIYCSIINENELSIAAINKYMKKATVVSINMNTFKMTKIMDTPTIARSGLISRDRSVLLVGTQRGCFIWKLDRKNYRVPAHPTLPGSINVIINSEDK